MSGPSDPLHGLGADERELLAHLLELEAGRAGDSIQARHVDEAPLSFPQQRVWVAEQLRDTGSTFNLFVAFTAHGRLDVDALGRSLSEVVRRHEVLRSTVQVRDGVPYLRVHEAGPVLMPCVDISAVPADARDQHARRVVEEEVARPFDLGRGPLYRILVIRCSDEHHVVAITMHHIVTDGWSIGVLMRELAVLYPAFRDGRVPQLPELPVTYGDVAEWSRARATHERLAPLEAFWKEALAGAAPTELPSDRIRPAGASIRGASMVRALDPDVLSGLERLGRDEGATRFMALLAAFALLLSRYSAQRDVVVGVPVAARDRVECEPLIGLFVNTLPVRVSCVPSLTGRTLIRQVRTSVLAALAHQDIPFDMIADAVGAARSVDRHPLFQITFGAEDGFVGSLDLGEVRLVPLEIPAASTRFDLEVHLVHADGMANVVLVYRPDLFDESAVDRMFEQYGTLLRHIVHEPDVPLDHIGLLDADARVQVVETFNDTARPYARHRTIPDLVCDRAASAPDREAVVCHDARLSYGDLDRRSNQVAHWLVRRGVTTGSRVAVCVERSVEMVVALLGVLKAGAAYVALDPGYPAQRLAYMAEDAALQVAVSQRSVADMLPPGIGTVLFLDDGAEELAIESVTRPVVDIHATDVAYVTYTSGSTGVPKGAEIPHRAVLRLLDGSDFVHLGPDETLLQLGPVTFDASTFEIWGALIHGGRLVVYADRVPQIDQLSQVLEREHVSTLWLTSSLFNTVIDQAPQALRGVRQLLTGGEALSVAHVRRALATLPDTRLFNGYGPTEATVFAAVYPISDHGVDASASSVPIGGPIANTRLYVVDDADQPVPIGIPGELLIGGDGVGLGYVGAPRLTASKFVPDPFSSEPGARLYRTGDRVRWRSDGTIEFLGRRDGQVKIRGYRIELGEVEAALAAHDDVQAAAVSVHQTPTGVRQLVGYVVLRHGAGSAATDLRAFVKSRVPDYMVPAAIVVVDHLPLTLHGKIDRAALPAPTFESTADVDVEWTAEQRTIAAIWAEVLGLPQVGLHDNFFDLGGDSILSIQVAARAVRHGLQLTPRHFFEHQTVAELASVAGLAATRRAGSGEPATGEAPLTPIARWFFERDFRRRSHFNQSALLELNRPTSSELIERALAALIAHHDALRSSFVHGGAGWVHTIHPDASPIAVQTVDLAGLEHGDQVRAIERHASDLQRSLRLDSPPLVAAAVFRCGGQVPDRLLIVIHHLVVDGVSWRILLEDLQLTLEALHAGRSPALPAKTAPLTAWARALEARAATTAIAADAAFWTTQVSADADLPFEVAAMPANTVGSTSSMHVEWSAADTEALLRTVPGVCGARIHEVLVAAVAAACARWTAQPSVLLALEGHGRNAAGADLDVSRTVGWFTSLYPLVVPAQAGRDPLAHVRDVAARLRDVPARGDSYGLLRYLSPDPEVRATLSDAVAPWISVNYLGQFEQGSQADAWFALAAEPMGSPVDPDAVRPYAFEVDGRVLAGRLSLDWTYSRALHERATVEALCAQVVASVRAVIDEARRLEPIGRAACDTARAHLSSIDVEQLLARYNSPSTNVAAIYPLTPLQLGMVVHSLTERGGEAFVTQMELVLDGEIDAAAMRDAWRTIQGAHATFRTAFASVGGSYRQVVLSDAPLPWVDEDWSGLEPGEQATRLETLRRSERSPFDPEKAPLMRLALIRVAPRQSRLLWTHHHALLDGWSVPVVLEQLFGAYDSHRSGKAAVLPAAADYGAYADWLHKQDVAEAERFWREYLTGATMQLRLAGDRAPGLQPQGARMGEQERWVSEELTGQLQAFAARHHLTLNTVVQAAWALLLARHSGEDEVVFGTAVAGRPASVPGIERLVGMFLNGLPFRARLAEEQHLVEWLADLQLSHARIREFDHCSLVDVHRWSGAQGRPALDATLAFENYPVADPLGGASRSYAITGFTLVAQSGAALHLRAVPGDRLRLMLSHDERRFEPALARTMLEQIEAVLTQFAAAPNARVGDVVLGPSAPAVVVPPSEWPGAVHEQIAALAAASPDEPALVDASGPLTRGELDREANRVASALVGRGVGAGQVVGVLAPRGRTLVTALLGVLRAGAAFAIIDPNYPPARAIAYLDAAGARVVVADDSVSSEVVSEVASTEGRQVVSLSALGTAPARTVCHRADPDRLAYVAFTSGSTGAPRAVLGRHAALAYYAGWMRRQWNLGPSDRVSMLSALAHDPVLRDMFPPLQVGAVLHIPDDELLRRPSALYDWVASSGITVGNIAPGMAQLLVEGASTVALSSLRLALLVGEPLTSGLVQRLRHVAPAVTCVNLYGATETQQALSYYVVVPETGESAAAVYPVGRGIDHVNIRVVRPGGAPAAIGEPGEIWMESPLLSAGYLGDEVATAAVFTPAAPGDQSRTYRTGDRGWTRPDGNVAILGRADDQLKVRGFRVEPAEIEGFLMSQPEIRQAAVAVVRRGSDPGVLAAWIVGDVAADELRQRMRRQFPEFMVPGIVAQVDELPRTASGKVDRRRLASRAPATSSLPAFEAPATATEQALARIWADVLSAPRVGRDDSFFSLGGHSLLAAQVVSRVKAEMDVDLSIADVFEHQRLSAFADQIDLGIIAAREALEQLVDEISGLSPEELQAILDAAPQAGPEGAL